MAPGPEPKIFENIEEILHLYFEGFEDLELAQDEKSPSEEGIALADLVVGNLDIKLNNEVADS